jgi:hypothetical protein
MREPQRWLQLSTAKRMSGRQLESGGPKKTVVVPTDPEVDGRGRDKNQIHRVQYGPIVQLLPLFFDFCNRL